MSLLNDELGLDVAFQGQPFVQVSNAPGDSLTLDFAFQGQPFAVFTNIPSNEMSQPTVWVIF
jgi:hypothetical protein